VTDRYIDINDPGIDTWSGNVIPQHVSQHDVTDQYIDIDDPCIDTWSGDVIPQHVSQHDVMDQYISILMTLVSIRGRAMSFLSMYLNMT
jgi:hypothetical protein